MAVVGRVEDFVDAKPRAVEVDGRPVCVVRIGDRFFAVDDICSHAHYRLSEGDVYEEELEIECWKHGSTFSLLDGRPQSLPATRPIGVHRINVREDGSVEVELGGDQ